MSHAHRTGLLFLMAGSVAALALVHPVTAEEQFEGRFFHGSGDVEYLQLLDVSRRMFAADPEFQNLTMLYTPAWNGLVEGPTWDAWWIQNSYGPTYAGLPFYEEPFPTFLQNAQDLWFDQMGDGKRVGASKPFDWVAPDGCLCDAARPGWIVYRQGDGRVQIHDWGMEFTAAGLLMQSELLLISRDADAIRHYLPRLERCAAFLETRRDTSKNLFLAGPAGNLLAPSYAGFKKPDGSYDKAYLAGLSVTYIAALDRLIELEKLAGRPERARLHAERRDSARQGLAALTTDDGYLIRSLDPDGTRHGVIGAAKHGYFEASPNHDAIAFRIVDDAQARRIYDKIAAIPGLRPHDLIIPNYPSYDDMYETPAGLWGFGTWVNGGHWSTCEARMILAYYRLGQFDAARRSMRAILGFARRWRMDNPLTKFGGDVYQPNEPINLCYDTLGPPAAMVRGLFEYLYRADGLTLVPHIPPGITRIEQHFPIRFGTKRLYLAAAGTGPVTAVRLNDREWKQFDGTSISLPYEDVPVVARICIGLGGAEPPVRDELPAALRGATPASGATPARSAGVLSQGATPASSAGVPSAATRPAIPEALQARADRLRDFVRRLDERGLGSGVYPGAHALLALECISAIQQRQSLLAEKKLAPLPEPARSAAEKCYIDTAKRLCDGLEAVIKTYAASPDQAKRTIAEQWQ